MTRKRMQLQEAIDAIQEQIRRLNNRIDAIDERTEELIPVEVGDECTCPVCEKLVTASEPHVCDDGIVHPKFFDYTGDTEGM